MCGVTTGQNSACTGRPSRSYICTWLSLWLLVIISGRVHERENGGGSRYTINIKISDNSQGNWERTHLVSNMVLDDVQLRDNVIFDYSHILQTTKNMNSMTVNIVYQQPRTFLV